MLPAALAWLAELFPGIVDDLGDRGAHVFDSQAFRFNIAGGTLLVVQDADVRFIAASRPLIEGNRARAGAVDGQRPVR